MGILYRTGVLVSFLLVAQNVFSGTHYPDLPSFEDYRKVGQVLQPYSRNTESGTYGVTLRVAGQNVKTLAEGRVYSAGKLRGYGKYVIVDHGHGWHSLYSNLARIEVQTGQQIQRGATLGVARHKRLFLVVSYRGNPIDPSDIKRRQVTGEQALLSLVFASKNT